MKRLNNLYQNINNIESIKIADTHARKGKHNWGIVKHDLDIKKFYPSINHDILKYDILRKKIKDKRLLKLLDEIVDSTDGVPIGNYLSQFFANLYLTYMDHWLKEEVHVKYYFRYADDIVILSNSKERLRTILILIKMYLHQVLKLEVKQNYQIFPVSSRGIDFAGYVFYHTHTQLRKSIKLRLQRCVNKFKAGKMSQETLKKKLAAYFGWLKYCDSKHLLQKLEKETGIHFSNWVGTEVSLRQFKGKYIRIIEIVQYSKYHKVHAIYRNRPYTLRSANKELLNNMVSERLPRNYKIL